MDRHFTLATLAGQDFWLPLEFLVASVAQTLGMMLLFRFTINTLFYNHAEKKRSHLK